MANSILVVVAAQRGALSPAAYELLGAGRQLADALKLPLVAAVIAGNAELDGIAVAL